LFLAGCQEIDTLKREVLKKIKSKMASSRQPFTPRDGITIRTCSLYQTANPNSDVIRKLPAETPVHLVDKVGDWFRVRMRDGREGYIEEKVVGGEEIIRLTQELRRSIEGVPAQAEGVIKTKANFRLAPGRGQQVVEMLAPGKKLEMYERVATVQRPASTVEKTPPGGRPAPENPPDGDGPSNAEYAGDPIKKDVWYKVKIEDGRVGYIYTHNLQLTPPDDIAREVPFMRLLAWRAVSAIDDPDMGAKNNYIAAYAPIGKDPGCDYTRLYFITWSKKLKRREIRWQHQTNGILPITDFSFEGKPGFSIRHLHPTKKNKLVLASFVYADSGVRKVSEEEIPTPREMH
jgi:hypothetical protein